jgi:L-2-hydroxycarboxylate dehydrogenase (NAD+)
MSTPAIQAAAVPADRLLGFCCEALQASGLSKTHAGEVAQCLLNADLWGVESHGVSRLPIYCERLRRGVVNARPSMQVRGATAVGTVHGDNGPGAVVGSHAMREAISRARQYGAGVMLARRSNHYGVAGHYARMALAHDCIGISGTNAPIVMAAWGASEPSLGTNPFAVAAPAGRFGVFALDMSSSVVAKGKILVAQRKGEAIPTGWALDAKGKPTTDASAAWDGVVLPFAGAKGSSFALFIEIVAGALAGAAMAGQISDQYTDFERPQDAGHFFIALHISSFMPLADFVARVEALVAEVKSRHRAEGFDEILIPGEIEARHEETCLRQGVQIDASLMARLDALAHAASIEPLRLFN